MPASSVRELKKAITGGKLEGVYLFHGEEEFLREAKIAQMIDVALDESLRDFNLDVRRGGDLTPESLDSLLSTPPLLANRRVLVVRDIESLGKSARVVLDRYLASPVADLLLILVAQGALPKGDKSLSDRSFVVEFAKLGPAELEQWILHYTRTVLSGEISTSAARLLMSAVGDDLTQLAAELDKLTSFCEGAPIDEGAVEELVGVRRGETLNDLLDAIMRRDARKALPLVSHVLSQPKTTGVSVVFALSAQMFCIGYARAALDEGQTRTQVESGLFEVLRSARGIITRPWGEAVRLWARAAEAWTADEVEMASEALLRADAGLKETRASSEEDLLISLILQLCAGRQAELAVETR